MGRKERNALQQVGHVALIALGWFVWVATFPFSVLHLWVDRQLHAAE